MRLTMLKGKIHRATVTEANVDYEGSLTVDATLLEASGILPNELIHVWDVTRGTRLVTYAMRGEPNSGVICVNGAGAHLVKPGDLVIVAAFADMDEAEARRHKPVVIHVDEKNRIRQ
jgi:aspartate 1-decarboxylase